MAMTCTYTTINGMLMMENRGGVATAYVPDTLGSLIQCRNSVGTKTYEAFYWPYGEVRSETGTNPSKWGFVGLLGYMKDLANLLYVRARYYKPNLTQWLTVDPVWPNEEQAAYSYGNLAPSIYADPSGLSIVLYPPGPWDLTPPGAGVRVCTVILGILICYILAEQCKPLPTADPNPQILPSPGGKPKPGRPIDLVPPVGNCPKCQPSHWEWRHGCHFIKDLQKCCIGVHATWIELTGQAPWPSCKCFYREDRKKGQCKGQLIPGPCPPKTDPRCQTAGGGGGGGGGGSW